MGCVYLLTNRANGLMYVGQTIFMLEKRLDEHSRNTRHGSDYLLHAAIRNKEIAEVFGRTETAVQVKLLRLRRARKITRKYVR